MSNLTLCNYCSLQRIKHRAEADGKSVSLQQGDAYRYLPAGVEVYVHPKGLKGKSRFQKNYRVAWFMELTDHCVC